MGKILTLCVFILSSFIVYADETVPVASYASARVYSQLEVEQEATLPYAHLKSCIPVDSRMAQSKFDI